MKAPPFRVIFRWMAPDIASLFWGKVFDFGWYFVALATRRSPACADALRQAIENRSQETA